MRLNELLNKLNELGPGTIVTDDKSNMFEVTKENELKVLGVYGLDFARTYEIVNERKSNYFKPKETQMYWYIDTNSQINTSLYEGIWPFDYFKLKTHQTFRTQTECQEYGDMLETHHQLIDIADRLEIPSEEDWLDINIKKYYLKLRFQISTKRHTIKQEACCISKKQGTIHCLNENFYDVALAEIGTERLTKYLKGWKW